MKLKNKRAQRMRFTAEERADPAMKKPIQQAEKAADQLDAAREKLPTQKKLTVQRAAHGTTGKVSVKLQVEDEIREPGKPHHMALDAASAQIHQRISEDGDDNTGVQAAHELEKASESAVQTGEQIHRSTQARKHRKVVQAEKRLTQANAKAAAVREKRNAPKTGSNPMSRWYQKRAIRRSYYQARAVGQVHTAYGAGTQAAKTGRKAAGILRKSPGLFPFIALGLMLLFVLSSLSSCMPLAQTMVHALVISTYPAEESDILAAERAYAAMEEALADELEHYDRYHPGYDEYIYDLDDIWHDPYALISIISAYHGGEEWTIDTVYPTLERYFDLQYIVTESLATETRYRTEIQFDFREEYNPVTGLMEWVPYEIEVQVPYEYTICTVTLENKNLSYLPIYTLSREKVGIYALYMSTLGNMPELFAGNPYASQLKDPLEYEVPQELLDANPRFAQIIAEAEQYIGFPYVWGGDSPETSFDCSGFVSWVFTNSGVYNTGRLGATGLHGACREVRADEVRPGDLVFFEGTMGAEVGGITHVGIYVGNGMMIHCGNPISYADLSDTYWQQHFYGYGRLPY